MIISYKMSFSSSLFPFHRSVLSWQSRLAVQNAMRLHRSQMVWFRKLYIKFSRYMVINSLREINQSDVEFEILDS